MPAHYHVIAISTTRQLGCYLPLTEVPSATSTPAFQTLKKSAQILAYATASMQGGMPGRRPPQRAQLPLCECRRASFLVPVDPSPPGGGLPESWTRGPGLWHPRPRPLRGLGPVADASGALALARPAAAGLQQCLRALPMTSPWPGPPRGTRLWGHRPRQPKLSVRAGFGACAHRGPSRT